MLRRAYLLPILLTLAWVLLSAFGTVSASQNDEGKHLGNQSSMMLTATPTAVAPRRTPTPQPKSSPPSKPNSPMIAKTPNQTYAAWQLIASEGFEGVFPSAGWTLRDLSNDGYERYWKDAIYWDGTAYRAHSGSWAAWPAAGGANSIYPPIQYANNMDTRMIYGPFDLSDAVYADADFYLWRETEPGYDYVAFEVSHDGINFQELARWDGSVQQWEFEDVYFSDPNTRPQSRRVLLTAVGVRGCVL